MFKQLPSKFIIHLLHLTYFLYFIAIFGVLKFAPHYLEDLRNFIKIFISGILIIKFNPFTNKKKILTDIDRHIVFSAGCFLLLSTSIISIIKHYTNKILNDTPFKKPLDNILNSYNKTSN